MTMKNMQTNMNTPIETSKVGTVKAVLSKDVSQKDKFGILLSDDNNIANETEHDDIKKESAELCALTSQMLIPIFSELMPPKPIKPSINIMQNLNDTTFLTDAKIDDLLLNIEPINEFNAKNQRKNLKTNITTKVTSNIGTKTIKTLLSKVPLLPKINDKIVAAADINVKKINVMDIADNFEIPSSSINKQENNIAKNIDMLTSQINLKAPQIISKNFDQPVNLPTLPTLPSVPANNSKLDKLNKLNKLIKNIVPSSEENINSNIKLNTMFNTVATKLTSVKKESGIKQPKINSMLSAKLISDIKTGKKNSINKVIDDNTNILIKNTSVAKDIDKLKNINKDKLPVTIKNILNKSIIDHNTTNSKKVIDPSLKETKAKIEKVNVSFKHIASKHIANNVKLPSNDFTSSLLNVNSSIRTITDAPAVKTSSFTPLYHITDIKITNVKTTGSLQHMDIELKPEGLGKVVAKMKTDHDKLIIEVKTENKETARLLSLNEKALKDSLIRDNKQTGKEILITISSKDEVKSLSEAKQDSSSSFNNHQKSQQHFSQNFDGSNSQANHPDRRFSKKASYLDNISNNDDFLNSDGNIDEADHKINNTNLLII